MNVLGLLCRFIRPKNQGSRIETANAGNLLNHRISYDEYLLMETAVMNVLRGNDQHLHGTARKCTIWYHRQGRRQDQRSQIITSCRRGEQL